jgi:murein DD-endopeptidase MepM/ murein hydrolase activator NlpD
MKRVLWISAALLSVAAIAVPFIGSAQSAAGTAADLQTQIDDNNTQIQQLDTEIAQYQTQLDATTKQKNTLQNAVDQLTLQSKQLTAKITVTKSQIDTTQLQIQQLSEGISTKQSAINDERAGLAESLRRLDEAEEIPLSVTILSAGTISDAWQDVDAMDTLQSAVETNLMQLAADKQSLTDTKATAETERAQLLKQQQTLTTQQGSLNATKKAQSDLLAQTKSKESTYQAIIAQKKTQEASFEQALNDLKAQFQQAVNPSQITAPGAGILQWPIDGTIRVTQYFGDTPFAQANPTLYSGHGHDGLDIGAPIGTPVHAALAGTVIGTGNTDLVHSASGAQCYSFGKWVMIQHGNGLNTMYAHLSEIDVTKGQSVSTGDVIGYSGETGYATGPHLHFGVYVSAVTKIIALGAATNGTTPCSKAVMPVPPVSGYLNPLNYLPKTSFIDDT